MKLPPGHVPGVGVHKATAYGGFGEKMLRGWGWEKGQGCGKNKQGISEAIVVKKKDDTTGIGSNNRYQWDEKWWENAFDQHLDAINAAVASDSDSDSDSEDELQLTTCQAGILRNRDGTVASASTDELRLAAAVAKDARGWAGRFGGREGKMQRIRRQEAEAAERARQDLGIPEATTWLADVQTSERQEKGNKKSKKLKSRRDSEEPAAAATSQNEEKPTRLKRKDHPGTAASEGEKSAKRQKRVVVVVGDAPEFAPPASSLKPVPKDWWGCKYFVSAGCLGGMDEPEEEAKKRQTFCEDDQENLYNRTQDNKAAGRLGLGVRGSAIKIAGGKYEGKKISFDTEEPGKEAESDGAGDKTKQQEALEGIKWKKLITKTLQAEESGNLSVRKLQKRVAAAALAKLGSDFCIKHLQGVVLQKLSSSSRFVVEGKLARCC